MQNNIEQMENTRAFLKKELLKRYPLSVTVDDGILVPEKFIEQPQKIMFLLKETFGDYNIIRGPQAIYNGKSSHFWPNFFNWTNAINRPDLDFYPKWKISEITNYIDNVAYVNVKKINENKKTSLAKDILSYAIKDADLLKYQMDRINPDVIFTSNVTLEAYKIIHNIQNFESVKAIDCGIDSFELYLHGNRRIIKTFHPSAFPVGQKHAFYCLKELIR